MAIGDRPQEQAGMHLEPWQSRTTPILLSSQSNILQVPPKQTRRQRQGLPSTSQTEVPVDADEPRPKRRKHEGVRYGPLPTEPKHVSPDRLPPAVAPESRQPVNHHHMERSKAEAQLHGRKFQLDTSSCVLPNQDQLFTSQPWSLPQMMAEKEKLNATKDLLDVKDIK